EEPRHNRALKLVLLWREDGDDGGNLLPQKKNNSFFLLFFFSLGNSEAAKQKS
ncbi:hypothetical protein M9458_005312, partial [Cirrhinus mrigala]